MCGGGTMNFLSRLILRLTWRIQSGDKVKTRIACPVVAAKGGDTREPFIDGMRFKPAVGAPVYAIIHPGEIVQVKSVTQDGKTGKVTTVEFYYYGELMRTIPWSDNNALYFEYVESAL